MARLIDADALIARFDELADKHKPEGDLFFLDGIVDEILDAPEVDAEEVVRCCDCASCKVILDNVGAGHWHCKKRYGLPEVDPTDFCSNGERREGE